MSNIKYMDNDYAGNFIGLIDYFYPVGSYYETSDVNFDPNVSWGGFWALETEGLVHISAGSTYEIGDTGGNKDAIVPYHRHSVDAITSGGPSNNATGGMSANASHSHSVSWQNYNRGTGGSATVGWIDSSLTSGGSGSSHGANVDHTHSLNSHTHSVGAHNTNYTGDSVTDANMQPYIVVNRWHRTA